jgi:membrane protease YdiL (CAAX protease family)
MAYAPHARFVAPALAAADLPRLAFGVVAIEGLYKLFLMGFEQGLDATPGFSAHMMWYANTATGLLLQLFSFVFLALAVVLVARLGHRRGLASLIGPIGPSLRALAWAFGAVLLFFALTELLPPYWMGEGQAVARTPLYWLALLPLSLLALLVQCGAEELFYRGYIQQQLAARFARPWVWMVLPNIAFALAHWELGDFTPPAAQYVIWAFVFGVAASDLTARTGNLGAAIGFHLGNNAYAFLLFSEYAAPDSGLALFVFPSGALGDALLDEAPLFTTAFATELAGVGLMWLAVRLVLRR